MKKTFLLFLGSILITTAAIAQTTKFGYVDSRALLEVMPDYKKADGDLQAYAKSFQEQLETMGKEYQKKGQEYQSAEKTMTDAVREVKQKELVDLQTRMESTQQSAQDKVAKKREELLSPILEKADKAIKEVAKEQNYDYVFDASVGTLLYAKPTDDILPLVKAKLGIK